MQFFYPVFFACNSISISNLNTLIFLFAIDKLYMGFHPEDGGPNKNSANYVLFTNDKSLVFTSFFADFGPLDLGLTYKFCTQLCETMVKAKDKGKPVLYSCSSHPHHRSNGAVLICAFMVSNT